MAKNETRTVIKMEAKGYKSVKGKADFKSKANNGKKKGQK